MPDSQWWDQQGQKRAPRQPVPGEPLFQFSVGDTRWRCELRTVKELGVEAQFFANEEFRSGRFWPFREEAVEWARRERRAIERDCF